MDTQIDYTAVENAMTLKFSKASSAFEAVIRGSDSRRLFDVKISVQSGSLVADFTELGNNHLTHKIMLEEVVGGGTATQAGGKRPHYSGRSTTASVALWRSEYTPTSIFLIFTDQDAEAEKSADALWGSVGDDEATEMASTFFEQADGKGGRPDESDAELREQLEHTKLLANG